MATFDLGMDVDDVQEAQLLPEDWYNCEVVTDPEQQPNKAMKGGGPDADKAGFNIVLRLRVVDSLPEYNGRQFTMWLPLPNDSDDGVFAGGQPARDSKVARIAGVASALSGESVKGSEATIVEGMRARFLITQKIDNRDGQTLRNELAPFTPPRPIGGEELSF